MLGDPLTNSLMRSFLIEVMGIFLHHSTISECMTIKNPRMTQVTIKSDKAQGFNREQIATYG